MPTPEELAAAGWMQPEPDQSGHFLTIAKDSKARIRICSQPMEMLNSYTDDVKKETRTSLVYGFLVIHKFIDGYGKAVREVKGYKAPKSVYQQIHECAQKEEWGIPTQYDLEITRDDSGRFVKYTVLPIPASNTRTTAPITEADKKLLHDSGLTLEKLYQKQATAAPNTGEAPPSLDDDQDPFADE